MVLRAYILSLMLGVSSSVVLAQGSAQQKQDSNLATDKDVAASYNRETPDEAENEQKPVPDNSDIKPVGVIVAKNLNDALVGAYNNNPALLQARRDVFAQQQKLVQANAAWLPTISADASISQGQTMNSGNSKDGGNGAAPTTAGSDVNQRQAGIAAKYNLFNGGAVVAQIKQADQATRGLWAQVQSKEQEIMTKVIEAYLTLIQYKAAIQLYEANKLFLKKSLDAAIEKMKIGEETKTQVAIAESKLADGDAQLQNAIATYETAKGTFTSLTGLKPADILERPKLNGISKDIKNVIDAGMKENPDVIAAQFEHLAAQSSIDAQKGGYYPKIDIVAQSQRTESRSNSNTIRYDQDFRSKDYATNNKITVGVSYSLFDAGLTRSQTRQAYEQSASKRVAIEGARLAVRQSAIKAWEAYQAAMRNVENYKKQVAANEVSLDGTQQEMDVGTKILLDVLRQQAELLQSQLNLVQSEKDVLLQGFTILASMGQLHAKTLNLPVETFNPQKNYENLLYS